MKETYANSQKLFYFILRMPKEHSSFFYFTMEANEGISFYSTLDRSLGTPFRDIEVQGAIEYLPQFHNILECFTSAHDYQILEKEVRKDLYE